MNELNGLTAIITGSSGGIGGACVKAFVEAGARVIMADIDESSRDMVERFGKGRCHFIRTDLADAASIRNLIETTIEVFGAINVLLNNGARVVPNAPIHETSIEEFEALVAVNVRGLFLICKYAYPYLKESKGSIINMSSMAGDAGEKHHCLYAAGKGFMNGLTKSMAIDYGREGIRCNAIAPSSVLTPNVDRMIAALPNASEVIEMRKNVNLLGYTSKPHEIASAAVFLASRGASFITGAVIPVSGGSECGYGIKY
jgi:meso-butanediol dehydrogenase/(S,S)-butanediol dehydrogenase/diacetyl reductase